MVRDSHTNNCSVGLTIRHADAALASRPAARSFPLYQCTHLFPPTVLPPDVLAAWPQPLKDLLHWHIKTNNDHLVRARFREGYRDLKYRETRTERASSAEGAGLVDAVKFVVSST